MALTSAQKIQQMNAQLENTQKELGEKLIPIFNKLATASNAALDTINWLFFTEQADIAFKEIEKHSQLFARR